MKCKNQQCKCKSEDIGEFSFDQYCSYNCSLYDQYSFELKSTDCNCGHSVCIIEVESKPLYQEIEEATSQIQMPWNRLELIGWTISACNHYIFDNNQYLYISMQKGNIAIKAEGDDESKIFEELAEQATKIEGLDKCIAELIPKLHGRSIHSVTYKEELWQQLEALLEQRGILKSESDNNL